MFLGRSLEALRRLALDLIEGFEGGGTAEEGDRGGEVFDKEGEGGALVRGAIRGGVLTETSGRAGGLPAETEVEGGGSLRLKK